MWLILLPRRWLLLLLLLHWRLGLAVIHILRISSEICKKARVCILCSKRLRARHSCVVLILLGWRVSLQRCLILLLNASSAEQVKGSLWWLLLIAILVLHAHIHGRSTPEIASYVLEVIHRSSWHHVGCSSLILLLLIHHHVLHHHLLLLIHHPHTTHRASHATHASVEHRHWVLLLHLRLGGHKAWEIWDELRLSILLLLIPWRGLLLIWDVQLSEVDATENVVWLSWLDWLLRHLLRRSQLLLRFRRLVKTQEI